MFFPLLILWPYGLQLFLQVGSDIFSPYSDVEFAATGRTAPIERPLANKPTGSTDRCWPFPDGFEFTGLNSTSPLNLPRGRADGGCCS